VAQIIVDNSELAALARTNEISDPLASAKGRLWDVSAIEEVRWDKQYPYQLLVLRSTGGRSYVRAGTYTLPIPPQAIQGTWRFAIATTGLLDGIQEEHSGIPFRPIILQATTGVLPARGAHLVPPVDPAQSIFAGTVLAATAATSNFTAASVGGQIGLRPSISDADFAPGAALSRGTGYYQFEVLKRFLEAYAELKKTAAGKPYRLALAMWKTREVLLVTPTDFFFSKVASANPHRWSYTLSLKAWGRVDLEAPRPTSVTPRAKSRDPAVLKRVVAAIDLARRGVADLHGVFQGVRQDINAALFEPLREVALFCKDALGLPLTAADLPVNVIRDAKAAIVQAAGARSTADAIADALAGLPQRVRTEIDALIAGVRALAIRSGKADTLAAGPVISAMDPDPANKILENPTLAYPLFAAIRVGDLHLAPSTTSLIVGERERVRSFDRAEFEARRDSLAALRISAADALGAGSEAYDEVHGRPSAPPREPTETDFEALAHLDSAIQSLDTLVASDSSREPSPEYAYIAALAAQSGIMFATARSKFVVPFPYGASLEGLAARYLGDPDRWHEIAAINNLAPPYIDEEGFDVPLTTNPGPGEVTVASAGQLAPGQLVWISSSAAPKAVRRVVSVLERAPGTVVVELDGDPDLSAYRANEGAAIHGFAPNTVNSLGVLAIPSPDEPDDGGTSPRPVPGVDERLDDPFALAGADLLLTQEGDPAITPDGDWKYAVGLACVVQRFLTFVRVPRGTITRSPTYGFPLKPGQSTADVSATEIVAAARALGQFDPIFSSISSAAVHKNGPIAALAVEVAVEGGKRRLPVVVEVKR
jgi:hypothetical protein